MSNLDEFAVLQAESHPLVTDENFSSLEEYCQHLIHMKAYDVAAEMSNGKVVLDYGCNNGYGTALMSDVSKKVIGVDVSRHAIESAHERYGKIANTEFYLLQDRVLPLDDNTVDMVVSFQVVEHIENTTPYFDEIRRVLRPDGVAVFTTPNAAIRLDPGMRPWNKFHFREYVATELQEELIEYFSEVSIYGLFATEGLYQLQYQRCQRTLEAARRRAINENRTDQKPPSVRGMVVAFAKKVLPQGMIDSIRARTDMRGNSGKGQERLDPATIKKYSINDFYYKDENFNYALNLMAICRKPCPVE